MREMEESAPSGCIFNGPQSDVAFGSPERLPGVRFEGECDDVDDAALVEPCAHGDLDGIDLDDLTQVDSVADLEHMLPAVVFDHGAATEDGDQPGVLHLDRKSTRLNSSHVKI